MLDFDEQDNKRTEATEMHFLRAVTAYCLLDHRYSADILKELKPVVIDVAIRENHD
jgi:hypothetical protein